MVEMVSHAAGLYIKTYTSYSAHGNFPKRNFDSFSLCSKTFFGTQ